MKYIVYGASGHAKVVTETIRSIHPSATIQIYDDDANKKTCLNIRVIHDFNSLDVAGKLLYGIGDNSLREKITAKINDAVDYAFPVIHESAIVSPTATLGNGTLVVAGAIINADAKIGKHCIINTSAIVEHDCHLEDYVHISPNATLSGNVSVGEGTHIGSGATVIPGIKIGKWCTIGAGAVVTKNLPNHCTAVGIPAKPL